MLKKNKITLLATAGVVVLWLILYSVMVSPNWSQRDNEVEETEDQLGRWVKLYKEKEKTKALPVANEKLDDEMRLLNRSLSELGKIEFTKEMTAFTITAVGKGDPNNYFDRKRKETASYAQSRLNIMLAPGINDNLGFVGKHTKDPVPLNLARLFMVRRFFEAAKRAGIREVLRIQYPRPGPIMEEEEAELIEQPDDKEEEEEAEEAEKIFQIPMVVRMRSPERNFAQFLYELQRPSEKNISYFCLRAFLVSVREESKGVIDSQVAVAALFPEKQYLEELKIPFVVKSRGPSHTPRPVLDPGRY